MIAATVAPMWRTFPSLTSNLLFLALFVALLLSASAQPLSDWSVLTTDPARLPKATTPVAVQWLTGSNQVALATKPGPTELRVETRAGLLTVRPGLRLIQARRLSTTPARYAAIYRRIAAPPPIPTRWIDALTAADVPDFARASTVIDVDAYRVGNSVRYAVLVDEFAPPTVVVLANSSASLMESVKGMVPLSVASASPRSFVAVLGRSSTRAFWRRDATLSELRNIGAQRGARVAALAPYSTIRGERFVAGFVTNVAPVTEAAADALEVLRKGGTYGLFMKQLRGDVLAALNEDVVHEPTEAVRSLHLTHVLGQLSRRKISLLTELQVGESLRGNCPLSTGAPTIERIGVALQGMMQGDTRRLEGIREFFLTREIVATATSLGMEVALRHRVGCVQPASGPVSFADQPNRVRLSDWGRLYEAVTGSFLNKSSRELFFSLMPELSGIEGLLKRDAAMLGASAMAVDEFVKKSDWRGVSGRYEAASGSYWAINGYVKLAVRENCDGGVSFKEYGFGAYIADAEQAGSGMRLVDLQVALFQNEIKSAAMTWASDCGA